MNFENIYLKANGKEKLFENVFNKILKETNSQSLENTSTVPASPQNSPSPTINSTTPGTTTPAQNPPTPSQQTNPLNGWIPGILGPPFVTRRRACYKRKSNNGDTFFIVDDGDGKIGPNDTVMMQSPPPSNEIEKRLLGRMNGQFWNDVLSLTGQEYPSFRELQSSVEEHNTARSQGQGPNPHTPAGRVVASGQPEIDPFSGALVIPAQNAEGFVTLQPKNINGQQMFVRGEQAFNAQGQLIGTVKSIGGRGYEFTPTPASPTPVQRNSIRDLFKR